MTDPHDALRSLHEELIEEADFLWNQRQAALDSRDDDLADLAELEERLAAHLDALLLGGDAAWELLVPLLAGGEGEAFAAASVALAAGGGRIDALREALEAASGPTLAGIGHALCLGAGGHEEDLARERITAPGAPLRTLALDVLSFRRAALDPEALAAALADPDTALRIAALVAVGRLREGRVLHAVEGALADAVPEVRGAALAAGALLGSPGAPARAREAVDAGAPEAASALALLGHLGRSEDLPRLLGAASDAALAEAAVAALGWLGDGAAVEHLVALSRRPELAAAAGEAVARITGVDLEPQGLVAPPAPPAAEADDDEAPADERPRPDPARLAAWWRERAPDFPAGRRFRNGAPHGPEALRATLLHGPLADRHGAALEMALADPAAPGPETRAPARDPLKALRGP